MKTVALISLYLLVAACAPQIRFMRYTSADYAATKNVEVLQIKPPNKQFKELGVLSVRLNKHTEENGVLYLVERAREIAQTQ